MSEKEISKVTKEATPTLVQKIVVIFFFVGGLGAVIISVMFPTYLYSWETTWQLALIQGVIGIIMTIIGWKLKKKYQVPFS